MEASGSDFNKSKEVCNALAALKEQTNRPKFTDTKHWCTENDSPDAGSSKHQPWQEGRDMDILQRARYELVPDVIEYDHGMLELGYKVCTEAILVMMSLY